MPPTTRPIVALLCASLVASGAPAVVRAQDSTQPLLGATKIVDTMWIIPSAKGFDYALNDNPREYAPLRPDVTFVAPGHVKLAYKGFNPLVVAVAASETKVPDPNFKQLSDFLDALAKLPDLVSQKQSANLMACPAVNRMKEAVQLLNDSLNKSSTLPASLTKWRNTASKPAGSESVRSVQTEMQATVRDLRAAVKTAQAKWEEVAAIANGTTAEDKLAAAQKAAADQKLRADQAMEANARLEKELAEAKAAVAARAKGAAPQTKGAAPSAAPATSSPAAAPAPAATGSSTSSTGGHPGAGSGKPITGPTEGIPSFNTGTTNSNMIPASTPSGMTCDDINAVVQIVAASIGVNDVPDRIERLGRLADALEKLQASLNTFIDTPKASVWIGDSYVFHRTDADPKQINTIQVKAVPVGIEVVSNTLVRTLDDGGATAVSFKLRQHGAAVVEVVPGFVVAKVSAPQYETGLDAAGKTVIVRGRDKEVSYGGALLLNAILGASRKSPLYPMVQVGVSISPDGPGVLLGLGGRFGAPRSIGFSAGGILAWVKDLQTLAPGSPVGSKNDIKADLGYEPTVKWYFAIQYKFN